MAAADTLVSTGETPPPLVSVLMSVHNGERHLRAAMDSVLGQTFDDFEFIVVDDGSGDGSAAILASYAHDRRVVRLTNPSNIGLTASLNLGLARARGTFVARMDADDVALPDRLRRQVDHLRRHPDLSLLGLFCVKIDDDGTEQGVLTPAAGRDEARWESLFINPFPHPGVMFRRSASHHVGGYDESLGTAQDFDLFTRMLDIGDGENLPEFLLRYRVHAGSVTARRRDEQLGVHDQVMGRTIARVLGRDLGRDQLRWLRSTLYATKSETEPAVPAAAAVALYLDLLDDFLASGRVTRPAQVVARAFFRILVAWKRHGLPASWLPYLGRLCRVHPLAVPATAVFCLRLFRLRRQGRAIRRSGK